MIYIYTRPTGPEYTDTAVSHGGGGGGGEGGGGGVIDTQGHQDQSIPDTAVNHGGGGGDVMG